MIRPATIYDVDEAEKIYDEVLDYEAEHGTTTNWVKGKYPTRKTAEKALAAGTYYVGEDENGRIFGTVNLNHIQPAEYANIPWTMEGEGDEVLVVHTLCIRPDCRGKGY
ncbi:MAG: GNAT family N-acetyltransferase, partial [Anaerotignum sp.]|nr:GNAT family N-acetyltransferase [Anaerotignum sp.]